MTYHNAIKYIKNAPNVTPKNSSARERIESLFKALGDPQKKIKYIRLAGSNGKSVCAHMMTSVLNSANILSGCLTMPLLSELRENIKIGGVPLSIDDTVYFTEKVSRAVAAINEDIKANSPDTKAIFAPTSHEIMLCIAMLAFCEKSCRLVLIESDHSTEDPSRFLSTPLSTIICGAIPNDDNNEIAKIRSYIQRGITEIISVPQNPDAFDVIAKTCHDANCRLTISVPTNAKISSLNLRGTVFTYRGSEYKLKICGRFQVANAILAIESSKMLIRNKFKISNQNIIDGIEKTTLPSKFEVISLSPTIIIDSTHTPIAIETVSDSMAELKSLTGNKVRLCLTDEELCPQYVNALLQRGYEIESIIALPSSDEENSSADDSVIICKTPKNAAKKALTNLTDDILLLVSGRTDLAEKIRYEILAILGFG
jgi:dihydrofolate synthase/folylpolyglutamate synthase